MQALAAEFRLTIRPDAHPEAGHYYRSDHFSLARVGIPAFSVNEGVKYKGHDAAWGLEKANEYTEKHYHQPSDEYHPDMDFTGDAVMARFGFALGWQAASTPKLVGWQKGDEFEAARSKSQHELELVARLIWSCQLENDMHQGGVIGWLPVPFCGLEANLFCGMDCRLIQTVAQTLHYAHDAQPAAKLRKLLRAQPRLRSANFWLLRYKPVSAWK